MKIAKYSVFAPLLLAACGQSGLERHDNAGLDAPEIEVAQASGSTSEKIARAEARLGKPFHQMTMEERTDALAARDMFGNKERNYGPTRSISRDERREILRREQDAGY